VIHRFLTIVCLTGLLSACENILLTGRDRAAKTNTEAAAGDDPFTISVLTGADVVAGDQNLDNEQRQFIADILFEGLQALDADRLLTPIENNAYDRFRRVLTIDPDNALALQGLADVAARYLELSLQASRRGLFAEAATMLENARFVNPQHPELAAVSMTLQAEQNSGDLFFDVNNNEVSNRSETARSRLFDIARQARELSANVLITAPNDDNARWMFNTMREGVEGYRLRGSIELASRTTIRLRLPRTGLSD